MGSGNRVRGVFKMCSSIIAVMPAKSTQPAKFMSKPTVSLRAALRCVAAAIIALFLIGCRSYSDQPSESPGKGTANTAGSTFVIPASPAIRIKAGTTAPYTDPSGNVWLPDQGFADGETITRPKELAIANTPDPELYRTERYSMTSFSRPLLNGDYTVKLHFAETFEEITGPGQRVFSFNVEGQSFKDFDVFAKAGGGQRALVQPVNVRVADGKLDITFTSNVQNPEINALEIIPGR